LGEQAGWLVNELVADDEVATVYVSMMIRCWVSA
jgi:hypothetical protein